MKLIILQCERCGRRTEEPEGSELYKVFGLFNGSSNDPMMNPLTGWTYGNKPMDAAELCICCYDALKAQFFGRPIDPIAQGTIENERRFWKEMKEAMEPEPEP